MLAVDIHRDDSGARFRRTPRPVDLVLAPSGTPWETIATTEQTWALDVSTGPLARCTLSTAVDSSVIVMTFAHQIADGLSGTAVLRDLVRAMNGDELHPRPLPVSQEELLDDAARVLTHARLGGEAAGDGGQASGDGGQASGARLLAGPADAVLSRRGAVRPFDGARPRIETLIWSKESTDRAISAAHARSTTLHALVTAAAVRVIFADTGRASLALMNPMDIRRPAGADDSLSLSFLSTRLGFLAERSGDIWALAQEIRQELKEAQTLSNLAAAAAGMSAGTSSITRVADAVEAMVSFANYDLMVTNLGDLGRPRGRGVADSHRVEIVDLFGPTMATQIDGEQILALSTFDGALRTTITTRHPLRGFLARIRDEVESALSAERTTIPVA